MGVIQRDATARKRMERDVAGLRGAPGGKQAPPRGAPPRRLASVASIILIILVAPDPACLI
jgi:hypothetical protein